jgi:superfamily II DNA or RNA helicase
LLPGPWLHFLVVRVSKLLKIEDYNEFTVVRDVPPSDISPQILKVVRTLDERTELEAAILNALCDPNETPHGPAEVVDILTHRVSVGSHKGMAAFILKGRAFPTVRPHHTSHQIFRLRKIRGLEFAVFAAVGNVLDQAKDEFITTAEDLGIDYSFFDSNDIARLFIAFGFLCPRDGERIVGGRCTCGYAPAGKDLNLLQEEALRCLSATHSRFATAGLVVMPTGSGKTRVAVRDVAAVSAQRVLYVANTHEILQVARREFAARFGESNVTHALSISEFKSPRRIMLASVQLLEKHPGELEKYAPDYMIVDEFHHAAAQSYRTITDAGNPTFLLGMTATPFRSDWQDIRTLCDHNVVIQYDLRMGINSGILTPYHYYGCFDDIDYLNVLPKNYIARDLERVLVIPERDRAIIEKWRELAANRATIAFCCSKLHAERVAEAFNGEGVPAATYLDSTSWERRQQLIEQLRVGDLKVLCAVDILNEGADIPHVECLLFLRPTDSMRIFFQQLGRGLRRYPGKLALIVIDFIGNFRNAYRIMQYHGLFGDNEDEDLRDPRAIIRRNILTLPLGCSVQFDNRVIDIFEAQCCEPERINRHNIAQVLIYYYKRLCRSAGKRCTPRDVDRGQILGVQYYEDVFGSWKSFSEIMDADPDLAEYDEKCLASVRSAAVSQTALQRRGAAPSRGKYQGAGT